MSASLLVHQAYFGAVNGVSHGQLASSLPDADLRAFLVAFTDRPGVVPHGVSLPPYLTTAHYGPYYLLSRTWADTAVARPGMVFTHVLLLPLATVETVLDLASLLQQFVPQPPPVGEREGMLAPLTLNLTAVEGAARSPAMVPESWLAVAHHLAEQAAEAPVFVAGESVDFEDLLLALWRGLPAPLRHDLTWGIRFAPTSARERLPWLVYVPAELADRWRGKALLPLEPTAQRSPTNILEQFLFGGEEEQAFRQFIAELGLVVDSFRTLRLSQQAYEVACNLQQETAGTQELLLLLRGLNLLQPDPNQAVSLKEKAVESLAQCLTEQARPSVLSLRNLPVVAFRTGQARLGPVVEQSVYGLVMAEPGELDSQVRLLDQLAETEPTRQQFWWQQAAGEAFTRALRPATLAVARVIWQGLVRSPATRAYVQHVVPKTADWEQQLQLAVPAKVAADNAELVVAFGTGRSWWELIATVLAVTYVPAEALARQLTVEKSLNLRKSPRLSRLATQVPDAELLALALREPNWQLQELAGERAGHVPELLEGLDVREPAWQVIWGTALRRTRSLEAGISQPAETIAALLTEVAGGRTSGPEIPELLEWIAASPFANVLPLPVRSRLWEQLPAALHFRFLQATLDALVAAILASTWTGTVEPSLRTAGQGREFTTRILHKYQRDASSVLAIDTVLGNLRDEYLRDYLAHLPSLTSAVAIQLGQLVAARRWMQSARALLSRAATEPVFRLALHECADMFSFWDKLPHFFLFSHLPVKQDGWHALEELLKQLYDRGPDESGIWRRAGGDPTELPSTATRAAQWAAAIRLLRKGGGGAITVQSLLQAALVQFPNNDKLRGLAGAHHLFSKL